MQYRIFTSPGRHPHLILHPQFVAPMCVHSCQMELDAESRRPAEDEDERH